MAGEVDAVNESMSRETSSGSEVTAATTTSSNGSSSSSGSTGSSLSPTLHAAQPQPQLQQQQLSEPIPSAIPPPAPVPIHPAPTPSRRHAVSHSILSVTPHLILHALSRADQVCFSIREIDIKLLRGLGGWSALETSGGDGDDGGSSATWSGVSNTKKKSHGHMTSTSSANLNEQAARVKARQLMLAYTSGLLEATKDEIRWLKDCGVLGKRAPKSSLMLASSLLQLLREQGKPKIAAAIETAMEKAKMNKGGSNGSMKKSMKHDHTMDGDGIGMMNDDEWSSSSRRSSLSSIHSPSLAAKRKSSTPRGKVKRMSGDEGDFSSGHMMTPRRTKRSRKNGGGDSSRGSSTTVSPSSANSSFSPSMHGVSYSNRHTPMLSSRSPSLLAAAASAAVSPMLPSGRRRLSGSGVMIQGDELPLLSLHTHTPPVLHVNPKDAAQGVTINDQVRFGIDHSRGVFVSSDGCTVSGAIDGSGSIRATHGITSGTWYIEIKPASSFPVAAGRQLGAPNQESNQDTPHCRIGIASLNSKIDSKLIGHDSNSYAYGDRYGDRIHGGEAAQYGESFTIAQPGTSDTNGGRLGAYVQRGDIIGMLIDLPPPSSAVPTGASTSAFHRKGSLRFYKNGVFQGVAWSDLSVDRAWFPALSLIHGMTLQVDFNPPNHRLPAEMRQDEDEEEDVEQQHMVDDDGDDDGETGRHSMQMYDNVHVHHADTLASLHSTTPAATTPNHNGVHGLSRLEHESYKPLSSPPLLQPLLPSMNSSPWQHLHCMSSPQPSGSDVASSMPPTMHRISSHTSSPSVLNPSVPPLVSSSSGRFSSISVSPPATMNNVLAQPHGAFVATGPQRPPMPDLRGPTSASASASASASTLASGGAEQGATATATDDAIRQLQHQAQHHTLRAQMHQQRQQQQSPHQHHLHQPHPSHCHHHHPHQQQPSHHLQFKLENFHPSHTPNPPQINHTHGAPSDIRMLTVPVGHASAPSLSASVSPPAPSFLATSNGNSSRMGDRMNATLPAGSPSPSDSVSVSIARSPSHSPAFPISPAPSPLPLDGASAHLPSMHHMCSTPQSTPGWLDDQAMQITMQHMNGSQNGMNVAMHSYPHGSPIPMPPTVDGRTHA